MNKDGKYIHLTHGMDVSFYEQRIQYDKEANLHISRDFDSGYLTALHPAIYGIGGVKQHCRLEQLLHLYQWVDNANIDHCELNDIGKCEQLDQR